MPDQTQAPGKGSWGLLLAYLAAALGLPSAAAALDWRAVTAHPALGAGLLAAAAVLIGLAGLAHDLWRSKYHDRAIDWISAGIDRRTTRFGRRYREHLLADLRFVDLRGLAGRFFDPDLSDVYVDVALQPRDPDRMSPSDLAADERRDLPPAGQRRLIGDFLGCPQPRVLAVIGAPGSGKTTLLRHTARQMCLPRRRRQGRDVPILLYLRDHVTTIVADAAVALPALVAEALNRYGLADPAGWLEQRLRAGDCVVMLDGLDEVARQEDRRAISEWVSVQVTRYPDNDFVVTSRPLGYSSAPIGGAITVQTQPFTPEQVGRFVYRWCLAEERRSADADDQGVIRRAAEDAEDLLARLRAAPALRTLTVNPLLLTMIATVHRHHGALPGSRAELYAQICQVLLWRRQDAKKLGVEPRGDQKERLMRVLAFEMMRRKTRDLATDQAVAIVRPVLRRVARDLTAQALLDDAASNGLFIERETSVRAFAHQTFQEYLAAAHIRDKGLQQVLTGAVGDVWWRETTLLYVAGADAGPIVEACLAASTVPAFTLAFDCADEAGELAEDLREKLDTLLAEGLAPGADPQLRRLMTGVTVTRHLRHVIETETGARVCAQPVTNRVYQLFLDDMAALGQHCPPDAPPDRNADPDQPVLGMRGSDAMKFVGWVNDLTGGQPSYRLPTVGELADPAVRDVLMGTSEPKPRRIWADLADRGNPPMPTLCPGRSRDLQEVAVWPAVQSDFTQAPFPLVFLPLLVQSCVGHRMINELAQADRTWDSVVSSVAGFLIEPADAVEYEDENAQDNLSQSVLDQLIHLQGKYLMRFADKLDLPWTDKEGVRYLTRIIIRNLRILLNLHRMGAFRIGSPLRVLDNEFARSLNLLLAETLSFDLSFRDDLAAALARGPESAVISDGGGSVVIPDVDDVLDSWLARASVPFLGQAFSRLLQAIPCPPYDPASRAGITAWLADGISSENVDLASQFADVVSLRPGHQMSPESLTASFRQTIADLGGRLSGDDPRFNWASQVNDHFGRLAADLAERSCPIVTVAPALRVMALCLAAEADALSEHDIGDDFREIAAGVTRLERRHRGDDPPVETLVLALD